MAVQNPNNMELLEQYRRAYNQLPEEERNGQQGSVISYLLQTGGLVEAGVKIKNALECHDGMKSMDHLRTLVEAQEIVTEDTLKSCTEGKSFPGWLKDKYNDFKALCSAPPPPEASTDSPQMKALQSLRTDLVKDLETARREMAENTVKGTAISSGIIIAVQFVKLYLFWKDIQKATNLTEDAKAEIPWIRLIMTDLTNEIAEITGLLREYEEMADEELRMAKAREVDRLTRRASRKLNATEKRIGNLRVSLERGVVRLEVRRDDEVLDGIANFAQAVAAGFQFLSLGSALTTVYKVIQLSITGLFLGLAGANVYAFVVTGKVLEELRAQLRSVRALGNELNALQEVIDEAEEWCIQNVNARPVVPL